MSECNYFKVATSTCLRTVETVIHFVVVTEYNAMRHFERACHRHRA